MLQEGVKADGSLKAIGVTDDGKLKVDASVSIDSVTVSNVEISNDVGSPVPVSGPLTDAQLRASAISVSSGGAKNAASVARVSASTSSTTLLAANANRRRVIIYNESASATLRIKLGATASATSYSLLLGPGDTYESPTDWVYTGVVDGIWSAASGAAQVTEI